MLLYHMTWKASAEKILEDGIHALSYIVRNYPEEQINKILEKYKKRYANSRQHKVFDKHWSEITNQELYEAIMNENGDMRYIYAHKYKPSLGNNTQSDRHLKQIAIIGFDYTQMLEDGIVCEIRSRATKLNAQDLLKEQYDFFYKKDGKHFTMFASLVPHFAVMVKKDVILPKYIKECFEYE